MCIVSLFFLLRCIENERSQRWLYSSRGLDSPTGATFHACNVIVTELCERPVAVVSHLLCCSPKTVASKFTETFIQNGATEQESSFRDANMP
jgi:hypothetical protein